MKSQSVGLRVSSVIFGLVALVHLARIFRKTDVAVGSHHLGPMLSWIAIVVSAALCVWLWKLAGPCCAQEPKAPPPQA
jgi:hypothetical protein